MSVSPETIPEKTNPRIREKTLIIQAAFLFGLSATQYIKKGRIVKAGRTGVRPRLCYDAESVCAQTLAHDTLS